MLPEKLGRRKWKASSGSGHGIAAHSRSRAQRSKQASGNFTRSFGSRRHTRTSHRATISEVILAMKTAIKTGADSGVHDSAGVSSISRSAIESRKDDRNGTMMKHLCQIGNFVRRLRVQARFGELSRAPLRLLRLQVCGDTAECDWIARPADPWDAALPQSVGDRNASAQALKDAITVRDLLFSVLPELNVAALRVYRQSAGGDMELIIAGSVNRKERAPAVVRSLAMRAKLFGLQFWLDEGILETLQPEEYAVNP
jgi:hypothetical protein